MTRYGNVLIGCELANTPVAINSLFHYTFEYIDGKDSTYGLHSLIKVHEVQGDIDYVVLVLPYTITLFFMSNRADVSWKRKS